MNLNRLELLVGTEAARREAFPIVAHKVFFAHAAICPLPRCAMDAVAEFARAGGTDMQENAWSMGMLSRARRAAAGLLGGDADEYSLIGPTTLGLNLVAMGFDWKAGDEVVYYRDCYPANVYPWEQLATRGVRAVEVRPAHPGRITWEVVEAALTSRTRMVALASAHFISGYRIDVDGIGARLRARGIRLCVDGIQTVGAFPTPVRHVDYLCADSHKWMLGPAGAGIFHVRAEARADLHPAVVGAWNIVSPHYIAHDAARVHDGARRYEFGCPNLPGIAGMAAALELLESCGAEAVAARILALRAAIVAGARARGFTVYPDDHGAGETPPEACSGIVSLAHASIDVHDAARRLAAAGIVVSSRYTREGLRLMRISPHAYNTGEEVDRLLAQVAP
jgi:selenocysteine lyase/cysteine desulfurase